MSHTIADHCDLDLWPSFKNYCVQSISLIFFEVGITNLVCICILGWGSVTYHFWVNMTLTSDLDLIIIVSGAYLLYYLRLESQFWCVNASWDNGVSCTIYGSLWPWPLTLFLEKLCPEHISYIIKGRNPKFGVDATFDDRVSHTIFGSLWPWSSL